MNDAAASHPWGSLVDLAPVLAITSYLVVSLAAYLVRCAYKGVPRDLELETRSRSAILGLNARLYFMWSVSPLWRLLVASRLRADTVTAIAGLVGGVGGVAVALGQFALGGTLFLASGILDFMDGRLARFRHEATPVGAAFDSVLDRYVDFGMLAGLAWYYRTTWVLAFVLLSLLGTSLVPYVRAKGEALGIPVKNGLMQRPERVLLLGMAAALSPVVEASLGHAAGPSMNWLAVFGVVIIAVTTNLTAVTRFRTLLREVRGESRSGDAESEEITLLVGVASLDAVAVKGSAPNR